MMGVMAGWEVGIKKRIIISYQDFRGRLLHSIRRGLLVMLTPAELQSHPKDI